MFSERLGALLKILTAAVLPDLLTLGGLAAIVYGVHLMNIPGAWITGGVAAVFLGVATGSMKNARTNRTSGGDGGVGH